MFKSQSHLKSKVKKTKQMKFSILLPKNQIKPIVTITIKLTSLKLMKSLRRAKMSNINRRIKMTKKSNQTLRNKDLHATQTASKEVTIEVVASGEAVVNTTLTIEDLEKAIAEEAIIEAQGATTKEVEPITTLGVIKTATITPTTRSKMTSRLFKTQTLSNIVTTIGVDAIVRTTEVDTVAVKIIKRAKAIAAEVTTIGVTEATTQIIEAVKAKLAVRKRLALVQPWMMTSSNSNKTATKTDV